MRERRGVPRPPGPRSLARIDTWAERHPGRPAIHQPGPGETTYGRLVDRARALALAILGATPGGGARVAVLSEDAATLAAALLGCLKANAVFVPLDAASPPARLAAIVADTRPALLLADERHLALGERVAGAGIRVLRLDVAPPSQAPARLPVPAGAEALAWIMYTSGSTGSPKGVMQTRGNVLTYAGQVIDGLGLGPADRLLLASPLHVHAGATLSLAALLAGASLVLVNLREASVERLAAILAGQAVTVLFAVPTVFRALARVAGGSSGVPAPDLASVRLLRLSGETITRDDVEAAWRVFRGLETLSVGLGATETGGISHAYFRRGEDVAAGRVSVGTPLESVTVTVVDEAGRPVPDGEAGELVVTGAHLSPGYWGDPVLTATAFEAVPGGRRYRTGDLGRRLPDGRLEHLGRRDAQVKIGGQRVELAEVEAALRAAPGVAEAAVRLLDEGGHPRLAAYLVLDPGARPSDRTLRAHLAGRLPPHMRPASFTRLPGLPLTRSGKVDVLALPAPTGQGRRPRGVLAASPLEATICRVWGEVLGLARPVARDDDFLALGGDSLQAARILARIEAELGPRVSPSAFFAAATPAGLAARLAGALAR